MKIDDTFEFEGHMLTVKPELSSHSCEYCFAANDSPECKRLPHCYSVIFVPIHKLDEYKAAVIANQLSQ